jgi:phage shock protein C
MLAGVAGGLATLLKVDPVFVRIGFLVLGLVNGFGVILYLLMWMLVPSDQSIAMTPREQVRENASELRGEVDGLIQRIRSFLATV